MTYRIMSLPMTLGDLPGHSPIASLSKRDFLYSCAAVDKISTDVARRAVPLRWVSFLFLCYALSIFRI